tara:strand:- start:711 stop:1808 length:1098 start_codon:yes stop_codon:yes gene_type:complete
MTVKGFNLSIIKTVFIFIIFLFTFFYYTNDIFFGFFLSFILIELFFGSWFFNNNFSSTIIPRNITKVWDPKHYISKHSAMYKRDEFGLRGDYKEISDIKIVTIGGSTTDERWIDEKFTWSYLLQNELNKKGMNIKIANAGVDGQSTLGHFYNFDLWFKKIPNFKPKYFLLYIGINDSAVIFRTIKSSKIEQFLFRADYLVDKKITDRIFRYLKNNSYIYKMFKIFLGHKAAKKYNLIHSTKTWNEKKVTKPSIITMDMKTNELIFNYGLRLKSLFNKIKDFGSEPIVVTQTLNKNHILFNYLKTINSETKKICANNNIKCYPLDVEINLSENEDFYDDVHTRPSGNKKIAVYIANNIEKVIETTL